MKSAIHRAAAHPSARACALILALYAACAVAEQICALAGAGLP